MSGRWFRAIEENIYSELKEFNGGVPQGLVPVQYYLLYTSDIPRPEQETVTTFADETAILVLGNDLGNSKQLLKWSTSGRPTSRRTRFKV